MRPVHWMDAAGQHLKSFSYYDLLKKNSCKTALLFCPPVVTDAWSNNGWSIGHRQESLLLPSCQREVVLNASSEPLERWWARLVVALLRRREPTHSERIGLRTGVSRRYAGSSHQYVLLQLGLERALSDAEFRDVAIRRSGLWLDFGVFRALSTNLTSLYLRKLLPDTPTDDSVVVDGFDTWFGLPETWFKRQRAGGGGPLNIYFHAGKFSWAEHAKSHGLGPTPPTLPRIVLHTGLFAQSLPPFLSARAGRPVAWASIDCDLATGTRDVLRAIGPRIVPGSRLHFHELLKTPDLDRAASWLRSTGGAAGRVEQEGGGKAAARGGASEVPRATPGNVLPPSDEARALYEWLRSHPRVVLELDATQSKGNREAALTVCRRAR